MWLMLQPDILVTFWMGVQIDPPWTVEGQLRRGLGRMLIIAPEQSKLLVASSDTILSANTCERRST